MSMEVELEEEMQTGQASSSGQASSPAIQIEEWADAFNKKDKADLLQDWVE